MPPPACPEERLRNGAARSMALGAGGGQSPIVKGPFSHSTWACAPAQGRGGCQIGDTCFLAGWSLVGTRRSSAPTEGLPGRCVYHPHPTEPSVPRGSPAGPVHTQTEVMGLLEAKGLRLLAWLLAFGPSDAFLANLEVWGLRRTRCIFPSFGPRSAAPRALRDQCPPPQPAPKAWFWGGGSRRRTTDTGQLECVWEAWVRSKGCGASCLRGWEGRG